MISVTLNGESRTLGGEMALPDLLASLSIDTRRVAVAVNGEVIPKREHAGVTIRDDDRVEIVRMVGGG